jgi:DNA (cytosine-5)-methyltransferase 1
VFIVATRREFPAYEFPEATHGKGQLLRIQKSGEYWENHGIRKPKFFTVDEEMIREKNGKLPWVTVRDALRDLPEPSETEDSAWMNHWRIPGARRYTGHTGSTLDWPAKTIKAGVHGVPGGENTVVDDDGIFRYFTLRETAKLQTFPDTHFFSGARIHVTKQIGNAVPCLVAAVLARPLFHLVQRELARRTQ